LELLYRFNQKILSKFWKNKKSMILNVLKICGNPTIKTFLYAFKLRGLHYSAGYKQEPGLGGVGEARDVGTLGGRVQRTANWAAK
jgi:hypothetical protein